MKLKEFLQNIGVNVQSDDEAHDFLLQSKIIDVIKEEWVEKLCAIDEDEEVVLEYTSTKSIEDDTNTEVQTEEINLDMGIFSNDNLPMEEDAKEQARTEAFALLVKNKQFSLQNGKVGQPYLFPINAAIIEESEIGEYWFEGLEDLGLIFNKESQIIEGEPTKEGSHKVTLNFKHKSWDENREALSRELPLVINPDPRSLWKSIPTPTDVPYYKSDSDKQLLLVEAEKRIFAKDRRRKDMVAASQRGRSHAHEGKARDDDFKLNYDSKNEWYTMVVADGAGSAKYSRKGSEIACETVIEVCSNLLTESDATLEKLIEIYKKDSSKENRKDIGDAIYNILGSAVFRAYKNIKAEAESSDSLIKDFSTTLIVAICKKYKFGWFIASFWVGDGGIGIYQKEGDYLKVLGESDGGEFAGQTRFLTMSEIMQPEEIYRRLRFEIVEDFTALILMTDGITDPKFETDANLLKKEKWDALWEDITSQVNLTDDNQEADTELLSWLDFWSQGNHDDRTIAILF